MPTAHTLDSLVWLFFSSLYLAPWLGPVKCFVTWCCECALSNITYPLINYLGLNSNHFLTRWFTAGCTAHHPHERPNCAVMLKVIYSGQMKGLINNGSLLLATPGLPVIICTLAACVHCLLIHRRLTWREGRRQKEEDGYCVVHLADTSVVAAAAAAAAVGSQSEPPKMGPGGARCPWGQPGTAGQNGWLHSQP